MKYINGHLENEHSTRWLFLSTVSMSNWNLEFWFMRSGRNPRRKTRRKPLGARTRTGNKLNPHVTPCLGIKPGPGR